jgi:hypothetical protein
MKKLLISGCLGAILAGLTGCEMLSNGMSGSLANVPTQVRRFVVDQKQVFQAVQLALKQMDFVLTRTAQAQGIVEGHSNLRDTAVFGAARQFTARIRLSEVEGGNTEVAILLHEQSEADFKGGVSNRVLREHGLYDSFFEHLTRILQEGSAAVKP